MTYPECRTCGNPIAERTDPTGQRGTAWATVNPDGSPVWAATEGDDRDFQCFADSGRHEPEPRTVVVFRMWKSESTSTGPLALFPMIEEQRGMCSSYERVGQHGAADYAGCIARTRPAKPSEFAPLANELRRIGYRLEVRKSKNDTSSALRSTYSDPAVCPRVFGNGQTCGGPLAFGLDTCAKCDTGDRLHEERRTAHA